MEQPQLVMKFLIREKNLQGRAKGNAPEVTEPNLRFLRFRAVSCENLRFPNASFCRKIRINRNQRKSAFRLGLAPQLCPLKRYMINNSPGNTSLIFGRPNFHIKSWETSAPPASV